MKRIVIEPGTELDVALTQAGADGEPVELQWGHRLYRLERVTPPGPISDEERAWREALVQRTLALRDQQQPLGITTAELIREMRAERYGE